MGQPYMTATATTKQEALNKMKILKMSSAALTATALLVTSLITPVGVAKAAEWKDPKPGDTVNVGFLGALSGPDAGWGLPGLTGNQMFIDEVNADGGLLVNGQRYPLKMFTFDDKQLHAMRFKVN